MPEIKWIGFDWIKDDDINCRVVDLLYIKKTTSVVVLTCTLNTIFLPYCLSTFCYPSLFVQAKLGSSS